MILVIPVKQNMKGNNEGWPNSIQFAIEIIETWGTLLPGISSNKIIQRLLALTSLNHYFSQNPI